MTHVISIIAEDDIHELKEIDPKKITKKVCSRKPYIEDRTKKENEGNMTRTAGLYGTQAMADEVEMTLEAYWEQISKACYLNEEDPIKKRKKTEEDIKKIKNYLDTLAIKKLHIQGEDIDLHVTIGEEKQRLG
jgi:aminopeptidase